MQISPLIFSARRAHRALLHRARRNETNALFVVWRARFIALFISIWKFIRDFYRHIDFPLFRMPLSGAHIARAREREPETSLFYSFPKCTRAAIYRCNLHNNKVKLKVEKLGVHPSRGWWRDVRGGLQAKARDNLLVSSSEEATRSLAATAAAASLCLSLTSPKSHRRTKQFDNRIKTSSVARVESEIDYENIF